MTVRSSSETVICLPGSVSRQLPQQFDVLGADDAREQALLAGVASEDVRESGGEDNLEAVVLERPHGVLTRRAGAEVGAGHEHRTVRVLGLVEDEVRVASPSGEERVLEAGLGDALEVDGRDDLVGVDVGAAQGNAYAGVGGELLHDLLLKRSRRLARRGLTGLDSVPRTAVAAATSGLTRGGCGRPCPDGPRSCGLTWTRCAPAGRADQGSCQGTSSSLHCATPRRSR